MDEKLQILLGSCKNVVSVDVDNFQKFELENKVEEITEYDIRNAVSATEVFDAEREANDTYRIYGRIEYLSLLNGLKTTYSQLQDFFLPVPQNSNNMNIFKSFTFYLLRAARSGYTQIVGSSIEYVRYFEVITELQDFEIYNAGFANNVYGDQSYSFNFNNKNGGSFDVSAYVDNFGFPATELFLYAQYKFNHIDESLFSTSWGNNGIPVKVAFDPIKLHVGDRLYGDLIEYSKSQFLQMPSTQHPNKQIYYINTPYYGGTLQWMYEPIIPLRLKYFYDNLNEANTGSTSYAQQSSIPYYATSVGNGNFVWRDIIPQGNIDPLTGLGVDYPFVNKKRYLFSSLILSVTPNLNDPSTMAAFADIKYAPPTIMDITPNSNLNNIGKPCL